MATTAPKEIIPASGVVQDVIKAVDNSSTTDKIMPEEDLASTVTSKNITAPSPRLFSRLLSPKKKPAQEVADGDQIVTTSALRKTGFFGKASLVRKNSKSNKETESSAKATSSVLSAVHDALAQAEADFEQAPETTPQKTEVAAPAAVEASTPAETPEKPEETSAAITTTPASPEKKPKEFPAATTTPASPEKTLAVASPNTPQSSSSSAVDSPAPSGFSPATSSPNAGEDQPLSDKAKKGTLGGKFKGFTNRSPTKKATSPAVVTAVSDALTKAEAEFETPQPQQTEEELEKDKAEAIKAMAEVQALVQASAAVPKEEVAVTAAATEEEEAAKAKAEAIKAMEEAQAEAKAREEALKAKTAEVTVISRKELALVSSAASPLVKPSSSVASELGQVVKMTFVFSYIIIVGGAVVYLFAALALRQGIFSI